MSIRFPKHCKTKAEKSAHASMVAMKRWDKVHAASEEPIRTAKVLVRLTVQRVGLDPHAIPLSIVFDGGHKRKVVIEGNQEWARHYGRKALVKWFNAILKSAGV